MGGTICRTRQDEQVSKSLLWLPWYYVNRFQESVRIAEETLGQPPTICQIFVTLEENFNETVNNVYEVSAILFSMLREDLFYTDLHSYRYTLTKKEGYYSYSEIFHMKFPEGYECDSDGRVNPTTARTVNFNQLRSIMKSKDEAAFVDNKWIWDGEFRFLDGESIGSNRVGFTSYPRSGNSFLRRYVEQITGITTGSTIHIHTSTSLQIQGLKGEGHIGDEVWVSKSHHPFFIKNSAKHGTNKTIFCVRHPLDVLPSYFSLLNTLSHGNKPDFDFSKDYADQWDWFVRDGVTRMRQFFEIMIKNCNQEQKQPLYIVRYEDLVSKPKETLMGLTAFLLDETNVEGSNAERRIDEVLAKGSSAATTYRLKDTTGKFDIQRSKYTDEQVKFIRDNLGPWIYYFGYADYEENPTGFFSYEEHEQENLAQNFKFREHSQQWLERTNEKGYEPLVYYHNDGEQVDLLPKDIIHTLTEPAFEYAKKTLAEARSKKQQSQ